MLTAQRRHQPSCKRPMWDKGYTKCACPVMIRGTLNGKHLTLSTWKFLPPDKARDIEAARDLALLWERVGSPVRPEAYAPIMEPTAATEPERPTVQMAVSSFMADGKDRGNSAATLSKKRVVFEKSLLQFCANKGIRFLTELDLNTMREWRGTWEYASDITRGLESAADIESETEGQE
jgi:hypothetical protein